MTRPNRLNPGWHFAGVIGTAFAVGILLGARGVFAFTLLYSGLAALLLSIEKEDPR
jgi:hypothetical protein